MTDEFSPISLSDMPRYLELLKQTDSRASDYSFANIFGWANYYQLEWRFDGTLCWLRQKKPTPSYWAPVGPWEAVQDWKSCPEIASGATFIRVPEALATLWGQALGEAAVVEESRGQWDYLYLSSELAALSGNRFHKKKNLVSQFQKLYSYEYQAVTPACVDTVMDMQEDWCRWRDCESAETLLAENEAVARVLAHWHKIPGLCGGIIRVDGDPVAYTIAEPLNEDTLIIHFEKAASDIKGAYQAINWMFCNDMGVRHTYINREQDLDDEGLRKAKLSYNPVDFIRKCTVQIR